MAKKVQIKGTGELHDPMFNGKTISEWVKILLKGELEEVVRCQHCRSWERNIPNQKDYGTCYCAGFNRGVVKHENGYCEKGERKNNHEE